VSNTVIWSLIKFFNEESHADSFLKGELLLRPLSYFKQAESEEDGRGDATEGVAMWWQPKDIHMQLTMPLFGMTEITGKDLAAPVSMSFNYHDKLKVFCLYALCTTGFEAENNKISLAPGDADKLREQLRIDDRCLKFGEFAVVMGGGPFIEHLRKALTSQGFRFRDGLVRYYDDTTFHGEIPIKEIPFKKQKRFSYQQEYRFCVNPRIASDSPMTINIGDISHMAGKVKAATLNGLFQLGFES
jgi:hypothetical protein